MLGYIVSTPLSRKYDTGEFRHKEISSPAVYSRIYKAMYQ
jgi:hypothetical protein